MANLLHVAVLETRQDIAPRATTHPYATDGRLIFETDDASRVADEEARAP